MPHICRAFAFYPLSFCEKIDGAHMLTIPTKSGTPEHTETCAQVAELVDALGSGPSESNLVEVRVFSWAPVFRKGFDEYPRMSRRSPI